MHCLIMALYIHGNCSVYMYCMTCMVSVILDVHGDIYNSIVTEVVNACISESA